MALAAARDSNSPLRVPEATTTTTTATRPRGGRGAPSDIILRSNWSSDDGAPRPGARDTGPPQPSADAPRGFSRGLASSATAQSRPVCGSLFPALFVLSRAEGPEAEDRRNVRRGQMAPPSKGAPRTPERRAVFESRGHLRRAVAGLVRSCVGSRGESSLPFLRAEASTLFALTTVCHVYAENYRSGENES